MDFKKYQNMKQQNNANFNQNKQPNNEDILHSNFKNVNFDNLSEKEYENLTNKYNEFANDYGNLGENQIKDMIKEQLLINKQKGMKVEDIENIYKTMEPMLDDESKNLIKQLIEEMKNA